MHRRLHPSWRAALALLALTLVACGGSGSDSAGGAAAVRTDVTKALTTAKREICDLRSYATERFVTQATFSIPELLEVNADTCRRDLDLYAADRVTLSRVKVDGDRATARVIADGGAFGYGVLDLALVGGDGGWKFDRITAVQLDRGKFNSLQRQFARLADDPLPEAVVDCYERRIARRSDADIERAIVRGDSTLVSDPLLTCVVRPTLRRALPLDLTNCVIAQLRRQADELLGILVREDEQASQKVFRAAAEVCATERTGRTV